MSKQQNGGPAFPVAGSEHNYPIEGMTLRDYFAVRAMQAMVTGFMSNPTKGPFNLNENNHHHASKMAYKLADAMLIAREAS